MDKAAIDIAKALVRLSEVTIFELRGGGLDDRFHETGDHGTGELFADSPFAAGELAPHRLLPDFVAHGHEGSRRNQPHQELVVSLDRRARATVHGSFREAVCLARRRGPSTFRRPQAGGHAVDGHARVAPVLPQRGAR